ncbi:putative DNA ligase [Leptomonas seymouri]|uniref:Putative DNA ligase n=1 Tax=Leptomonas seymouri TaxID=5684 RepID=A0A0N1HZN9_LEPSE|nr:putative DNA ligase [Leptomonas seymouri]|eukprot:KPI83605.1 putative DNA ligase [Leptomonas seymouri]
MLHHCRFVLASLPFVPMALSSLDTLEQRLEAAHLSAVPTAAKTMFSIGSTKKADQVQWFSPQCPSPFFISPKHDGVRLISYVPPTTSSVQAVVKPRSTRQRTAKRPAEASKVKAGEVREPLMTCYSRYGRPLYGLFWIEEELQLLRALCGDPSLIVDGELYLHQTSVGTASATPRRASAVGTQHPARLTGITKKSPLPAPSGEDCTSPAAATFKTGFLAVSALVHRLRGPSLQNATERDILQYTPALPSLCVFDIPSYSPCPNPLSAVSTSSASAWSQRHSFQFKSSVCVKEQRAVLAELQRVRKAVMERLSIRDVEQLRVVPNLTPFSQRLRTMNFLFELLNVAMASSVLRHHFCSSQAEHEGHSKAVSAAPTSRQARCKKDSADALSYHGGRYVSRIPYQLVTSLEETTQRVLPMYLRHNYEGAVIRSPVNTYDFKEKRKGTLSALIAPLLRADPTAAYGAGRAPLRGQRNGLARAIRGKRDRVALLLSLGGESGTSGSKALMVRAYSNGASSVEPLSPVTHACAGLNEAEQEALDATEVGERAVQRAKELPLRSETAVKILAYQDREYAILRPLLKEPSKNPNTRVLVSIPRSSVSALGYPIKPDPDGGEVGEAGGNVDGGKRGGRGKASKAAVANKSLSKVKAASPAASSEGSSVVVFYGLQCLAENGLVFNVSMPKLTLSQQKELLDHLLAAGKHPVSAGGRANGRKTASRKGTAKKPSREQKMASLTGLYATVKFSTLTEHGLPRFGTVKAIRGGKGWFM